jgi:hypothetical protein
MAEFVCQIDPRTCINTQIETRFVANTPTISINESARTEAIARNCKAVEDLRPY